MTSAFRDGLDIAIIGMAGNFPGADDVHQFWNNLIVGKNSLTKISRDMALKWDVKPEEFAAPNYIPVKGLTPHPDRFDHRFFGYTKHQADLMDPQMRILHQIVWHALEDAGCIPDVFPGHIGLFAGATNNPYWEIATALEEDQLGDMEYTQLTDKDHICSRISHALNLTGPVFCVQTQCSTSLVAVHLACQSLIAGECDAAVAGGISITFPWAIGYTYEEGMILSKDGICRPFSHDANGTVLSNGGAVVVLKRIEDARRDKDHIYAVIKGSAINNDGSKKRSYSAPSVHRQRDVILAAMRAAEVSPRDISYIEAHGTGTILGDPLEVEALAMAFASERVQQPIGLGSLKGNVGHLTDAAGVAGLIKVALAMEHGYIPKTINFSGINPGIDLDQVPFVIEKDGSRWNTARKVAAVSSFGVGGTNAHVIVENFQTANRPSTDADPFTILPLSAETPASLQEATAELQSFILNNPQRPLPELAHSLLKGRKTFTLRRAIVANRSTLEAAFANPCETSVQPNSALVFMFSGQGTQYFGMAQGLYKDDPLFRKNFDRIVASFRTLQGKNIQDFDLSSTYGAQLNLFCLELALFHTLRDLAVIPRALIGHSLGEITALVASDALSLEDGFRLLDVRARAMQGSSPGKMLAVAWEHARLQELGLKDLALAAINGPDRCVLSGRPDAVDRVRDQLQSLTVENRELPIPYAFHSPLMEAAANQMLRDFPEIRFHAPRIPLISNVTGDWLMESSLQRPAYWVEHMIRTVRFMDGLQTLQKAFDACLFVEIGPGNSLAQLARPSMRLGDQILHILPGQTIHQQGGSDHQHYLRALAALWVKGAPVELQSLVPADAQIKHSLPGYPFAPVSCTFDRILDPRPAEVFKARTWHRLWQPKGLPAFREVQTGTALVFADRAGRAEKIANAAGLSFTTLYAEDDLANIGNPEQYSGVVLYAWHLDEINTDPEDRYYETPIRVLRHLTGIFPARDVSFNLIDELPADTLLACHKALITGPLRVFPAEYHHISCKSIVFEQLLPRQDLLQQELSEFGGPAHVRYSGSLREVESIIPALDSPTTEEGQRILEGIRNVLITGGTRGIGLELAAFLKTHYPLNIALITRRSDFPELDAPHIPVPYKKAVDQLRPHAGDRGRVVVIHAGLDDPSSLAAELTAFEAQFGAIEGVYHTAGAADGALIVNQHPKRARAVFEPKVQGTRNLLNALAHIKFLVAFSSVTALLPVPGQIAYCSANAFLDAVCQQLARKGIQALSMNWDAWSETGMAVNSVLAQIAQDTQRFTQGFSNAEGLELILAHSGTRAGHVVLSKMPHFDKTKLISTNALQLEPAAPASKQPAGTLHKLLGQFLGEDVTALDRSFSELGGDSLMAVRFVNLCRKNGLKVPIIDLVGHVPIQELMNKYDQD